MQRSSGILMHITSLPGKFGIGDLGEEAYRFADFLKTSGQRIWQMLPIGPPGFGNVPYQSRSAFAGNPLLISLQSLVDEGLLDKSDLKDTPVFPEDVADFEAAAQYKLPLLYKACRSFVNDAAKQRQAEFSEFYLANAFWLDTFALFSAVKDKFSQKAWNTWEEDIRLRRPEAIEKYAANLQQEISGQCLLQYFFFKQWANLKKYCNGNGIKLIGDIPIFVALDSADVWASPGRFYLDEGGQPELIAGVPPDYFSKTGQRWGNPLYRWEVMKADDFSWWVERIRASLALFDFIRIDHFRGFEKYWAIPGGDKTAERGEWRPGPGAAFFETLQRKLGDLPIIAEDLGVITPDVEVLRDRFNFPGMRVLQFAFDGDPSQNCHLPHLYINHCVVYTGSHDNTTIVGWFKGEDLQATTQDFGARRSAVGRALKYLGTDGSRINWDFIRAALNSVADTAVIPMQDVLGLGNDARMNTPGTTSGNWLWRMRNGVVTREIVEELAEMTWMAGR